ATITVIAALSARLGKKQSRRLEAVPGATAPRRAPLELRRSIADSRATDLILTGMATALAVSHTGADELSTPGSRRRCRCSFRTGLRVYSNPGMGRGWSDLVRRRSSHPSLGYRCA